MTKWPPGTLGVLSVLGVPSQLKMSNLDCWGPGESIDTHIAGVWNKNDKVTFGYPWCPQCPWGPKSAQNVKSWLLGSRGVRRHPYCRGLEQKGQSDLRLPSGSSVSRWSWVSSKCQILVAGVQGSPLVPNMLSFSEKKFRSDSKKFRRPELKSSS